MKMQIAIIHLLLIAPLFMPELSWKELIYLYTALMDPLLVLCNL